MKSLDGPSKFIVYLCPTLPPLFIPNDPPSLSPNTYS